MVKDNNSKRIAKNTLLLYIRLLVVIVVSLYTSRIVLQVLGVVDFGIYNVVGGVVVMLAFLNTSMATGIQRFLSFELGKENNDKLKLVFRTALTIQVMLSFLIVILGETVGLWFLNNKMTIPADRIISANWVYQLSILSFVFVILQSPFNAIIIAHERMNFYAYMSIVEALLKLFVVFLIASSPFDKLVSYALLLGIVTFIIFLFYLFYTKKRFIEVDFALSFKKEMLISMSSFSGWNTLGSLSYTMKSQGINILLNMFFGPVINAARGLSFQVFTAINGFVTNFQVAFRPQMIKSYAQGDIDYVIKMLYFVSKLSFFLIYIISLPVLLETDTILKMWLGNDIPPETSLFTRLVILTGIVDAFATPFSTIVHATGKVKWFQIVTSSIMILVIPVSYFLFKIGLPPEFALIVSLVFTVLVQITRILFVKKLINFSILHYFKHVFVPTSIIFIISPLLPLTLHMVYEETYERMFLTILMSILSTLIFTYIFGLNKKEKVEYTQRIKNWFYTKMKSTRLNSNK
ncbi:MAG: lipopolysaccharide biosynthesis protein [Bacteroidota bacterium]